MNKQLKVLFCILAALLLSVSVFAACTESAPSWDGTNPEGYFVIPEYEDDIELQIGGFYAPGHTFGLTAKAFNEMVELGLTHLIPEWRQIDFGTNPSAARQFLERAKDAGLKAYVYDSSLGLPWSYAGDSPNGDKEIHHERWDTTQAEWYTQHEAFAGIHILDEPYRFQFDDIGIKKAKWKEEFPNAPVFCNAFGYFPGGTITLQYGFDTWRNYVNNFIDIINPDMLPHTMYPIKGDHSVVAYYFYDVAFLRLAAKEAGIPAWIYILASGHENATKYPKLSAEDMRWQIAVAMAYGYTSVQHYATDSPFGYDDYYISGERTDLWYNVQTANLEVKKWDNVYMRFAEGWKGTAPVSGSHGKTNPMFDLIEDGLIKPADINGVKGIMSTQDILFGVFEDAGGNKGFMATNAATPIEEADASVTVKFDKGYRGVLVYEKGVPRIIGLGPDGSAVINLESGEGKFLIPLKKR